MSYDFKPGICRVCQLPETDLRELLRWDRMPGRRKLPHGLLKRLGLNRWAWYRHAHGKCHGRFPYWQPEEFERRRQQGRRQARFHWPVGVSGNVRGRPVGIHESKPRRQGLGIRAWRAERRQNPTDRIRFST